MMGILIALGVSLGVVLLICRAQSREIAELRRREIMLMLAWRSPESVAGRDLLPGAGRAVRYGILKMMMAEGVVQEHEWGHVVVRGKGYRQFRYRLLPAGFNELRRDWR